MDDVVPPAPGVQGSVGGSVDGHGDAAAAVPPTAITAEGQTPTPPPAAPPSKRLRTQTGAAVASKEGRRSSSSGMQGGVGKLHSCIVKVRVAYQSTSVHRRYHSRAEMWHKSFFS